MKPQFERRARIYSAFILSLIIGWWLGAALGVPALPGEGGSVLLDGSPVGNLIAVAFIVAVSMLVCTLIAAQIRWDAGVALGAGALVAVSIRGATMQDVLLSHVASGAGVFAWLAVEVMLLFLIVIGGWLIILRLRPSLPDEREPIDLVSDALRADQPTPMQKVTALAMAGIVTALVAQFLCFSDDAVQCLAAVFLAGMAGAWCSHQVDPIGPGIWYILAPLVAAVIGYVGAMFWPGTNLDIGLTGGYFAGLARPLPLHWASAGVMGALFGYYSSRGMQRQSAGLSASAASNA